MKKRILLVNSDLLNGGVQSIILFLAKKLSNEYTFDLLLTEGKFDEENKKLFESFGGDVLVLKNSAHSLLINKIQNYFKRIFNTLGKRIKTIIQGRDYYCIHCFEEYWSGYYLAIAKKYGIKTRIAHFNINHKPNRNLFKRHLEMKELKLVLENSTSILACSQKTLDFALCGNRTFGKYTIVPNMVDSKIFPFCLTKPNHLSLLQVSRFNSGKNQLFSLKVLRDLLKYYPEAILYFVGYETENGYLLKLNKFIKQNNLGGHVVFLPHDTKPSEYYKKASYLIFPVLNEAFGMVLIEAQNCGLKCFSSDIPPIETNVGGVIFKSLNTPSDEWAKCIYDSFLADGGLRKRYDTSTFEADKIAKIYKNIYENG